MNRLLRTVLHRPALVAAIWALLLVAAAVFAVRLPAAVQGSSGNIEDS